MTSRKCNLILAAGMAGAIAMSGSAGAADLGTVTPTDSFNWSGFFVGAGVGAGAIIGVPPGGIPLFPGGGEGFLGEVSIGYDHLFTNRFLIGVFATGRLGGIESTLDFGPFGSSVEADTGFDIGARAGVLVTPATLAYVLGGYSHQDFDVSIPVPLFPDWSVEGYVLGAGLETVITDRLTAKIEYTYRDYDSLDLGFVGPVDYEPSMHAVVLGLNYRFGSAGAPAPVAFAAPAADWTGWFVSAGVGGTGMVHELSSAGLTLDGVGGQGAFGALGAGYDHDFGNGFVAGIEGRAALSGVSVDLGGFASLDADHNFDLVARLGYKLSPSALVYGLAGYTRGHFELESGGASLDWNADGLALGAGIETAVTEHLFAGVEYRYLGYEGVYDPGLGGEISPSSHSGQLSLKYKF